MRNKVNLIGRVGAKPELITFESGTQKASVSLATNNSYKDKSGEWVQDTVWHNVVAWGKTAESFTKALDKGDEVIVEGRLAYRNYEDKDGVKRTLTEIEVTEFLRIGAKPKDDSQSEPA